MKLHKLKYTLAISHQQEMLTFAPDLLPTALRKHMLSHSGSNTRNSSQISYQCMYVWVRVLCETRGTGKSGLCVRLCQRNAFILTEQSRAEHSLLVSLTEHPAECASLCVFQTLTTLSNTHIHTRTYSQRNTHGTYQGTLWLGLMT